MANTTPNVAPRWRGVVSVRLLLVVALLLVAPTGWWWWRGRAAVPEDGPLLCQVARADFVHELTEQGTIESANNAEIRCEVKSNNMSGTTILDIVPEGTMVEEGQEVAHLDSSALENDCTKQESVVNTSEAELITAKTAVETAELALKEYKDGTYLQLLATAKGKQAVAEENLGRAKEYAGYSERLYRKGYITKMQLEADKFAIEKAMNDVEVAKSELDVLVKYTFAKQVQTLESTIETAKAKLRSQQKIHELEGERLAFVKDQISKCTLRAPCAGQVVYANSANQWGDKTAVIEPGAAVRERQVVIRLPDRAQMLVKVKINESKIALVKAKQSAAIRLDALPDQALVGTVIKVDEYPIPTNKFSSAVKDYETTVRIHDPPEGLRPGLTAQVTVLVERLAPVAQVPVQAVFEHGSHHFCVLWKNDEFEARQVTLGSTNDKTVVICSGVNEGEQVVQNAAAYRGKVNLPTVSPARPSNTMLAEAIAPAEAKDMPEKPVSSERRRGKRETFQNAPASAAVGNPTAMIDQILKQYDKDGQGRMKIADLPERLRWLTGADANGDGLVDRAEISTALAGRLQTQAAKGAAGAPSPSPGS